MSKLGHNNPPDKWTDDEFCEDLMRSILKLREDPFLMEACHIGYIHFFGDSYVKSDFAKLVRKEICDRSGREVD